MLTPKSVVSNDGNPVGKYECNECGKAFEQALSGQR